MKVYLFDGEAERRTLEPMLAAIGAQVSGSDDFDLALQTCYGESFDLLLIGITADFNGLPLLERLRGAGSGIPAFLLTADVKRAVLTSAMKLGVSALLMKPVQPAELASKIGKLVPVQPVVATPAPTPPATVTVTPVEPAAASPAAPASEAAGPRRDVLLVSGDADTAAELGRLLPAGFDLETVPSLAAASALCARAEVRLVLVEVGMGGGHRSELLAEIHRLQPGASIAAVYFKSKADRHEEALGAGYHTYLTRPFEAGAINDLLYQRLAFRRLLARRDNVLAPLAFPPKSPRVADYYASLLELAAEAVDELAAECFDSLVVDLSQLPQHVVHTPELIVEVGNQARRRGLALRFVAPADLVALVRGSPGTRDFQAAASLAEVGADGGTGG